MTVKARAKRIARAGIRLAGDLSYRVAGVRSLDQLAVARFRARAAASAPFRAADICAWLAAQGIGTGSTLLVHSSWDHFVHFEDGPKRLLEALVAHVGPTGTLAMPAFPRPQDPAQLFDVRRTPSGAGYLTELFRRYPGVRRSINLNHSVCAIGPNADYLLRDHHRSRTSWDTFSPYQRLADADAFIAGLGVGHHLEIATSLHCVDSLLREELPFFGRLFGDEITYRYRDETGAEGTHSFLGKKRCVLRTHKLARHMDPARLREAFVSSLPVYAVPARYLIERSVALGRQGHTMYAWPIPWPWLFAKRAA